MAALINTLNAAFNNTTMMWVMDALYVGVCHFFLGYQLYKMNCKTIQPLRCVIFSAAMTLLVILPNYVFLMHWNWFFAPEALMTVSKWITFLLFFRNPLWVGFCLMAVRWILGLPKNLVASASLMIFCYSQLFALLSDGLEPLAHIRGLRIGPLAVFVLSHIVLTGLVILINRRLTVFINHNTHHLKTFFENGRAGRAFTISC